MIRRLSLFVFAVLFLVGCGSADDRVAVEANGESLTRTELIATAAFGDDQDDSQTLVNAALLRDTASAHIANVVFVDYFEGQGITMDDGVRAEIETLVDQRAAEIGEDSEQIKDFWVQRIWVQQAVGVDAYYDEVPGIFGQPPVLDDVSQLEVPGVLELPQVVDNPGLLNEPAFVAQLLAEPSILGEVQAAEFVRRRSEILLESGADVSVESRIGRFDPGTASVVAH